MFLSDADQLREARAFSKELESNVRRLARERDEARAAFAGAENSLTAERKHSARLSRECQERHDELRAEVEKLGKALTLETRLSLSTQRKLDEARAEVERLRGVVESLEADFARRQAAHRCATWDDGQGKCECNNLARTVAERQREACAAAVEAIQLPRRSWEDGEQSIGRHDGIEDAAEKVRATPLVTEGEL